jgi:crotonobetainyl-CoA:carnitine CoA-transferase CaiB-like acyl-CoA transferase
MPEYSAGISSVAIEQAPDGSRARVCQFRSPDGRGAGPRLRERIRWEERDVGYAITADPGNAFGLENSLELLTVVPVPAGTVLTWDEHYDHPDLAAARASFEEGLADIARRVVDRFGGRILERYSDAAP